MQRGLKGKRRALKELKGNRRRWKGVKEGGCRRAGGAGGGSIIEKGGLTKKSRTNT